MAYQSTALHEKIPEASIMQKMRDIPARLKAFGNSCWEIGNRKTNSSTGMDPARAKEIRGRLEDREAERLKNRAKGFLHTKRRRMNLKAWVQFQKQRFNFEEDRKRKMIEREETIRERCGPSKDLRAVDIEGVTRLCKLYNSHVDRLQEEIYDLDYTVALKNSKINQLRLDLDEMRGKFIKPQLKKVRSTIHWT